MALILADLVHQNLVDRRGEVFQPAAAGREFIESNRIYSNLDPTPPEVTLVDADTGTVVARVSAVDGKRVQVAGRTYQLLPGGSGTNTKVRTSTGDVPSPRYPPCQLPYAPDLGAAIAGHLGIAPDRLAVIERGGAIVIMTWLGKLLNAALAAGLGFERRVVTPGAFCLVVPGALPAEALSLMRQAVGAVAASNPLAQMKVERWADLGAHYAEFSAALQQTSKCDWLDVVYLEKWVEALRETTVVEMGSTVCADLLALA